MKPADPLDGGRGIDLAWQAFAVGFASARLFCLFLLNNKDGIPPFFWGLQSRFETAIEVAERMQDEHPSEDQAEVELYPGWRWYAGIEDVKQLYNELVPHEKIGYDIESHALGLALVGLHSVLELYCDRCELTRNGSLPERVSAHLRVRHIARDADLMDLLVTYDEVRHLYVHHGGSVSERYINNVKYNKLQLGEYRKIDDRELWRASEVFWSTASLVRRSMR